MNIFLNIILLVLQSEELITYNHLYFDEIGSCMLNEKLVVG